MTQPVGPKQPLQEQVYNNFSSIFNFAPLKDFAFKILESGKNFTESGNKPADKKITPISPESSENSIEKLNILIPKSSESFNSSNEEKIIEKPTPKEPLSEIKDKTKDTSKLTDIEVSNESTSQIDINLIEKTAQVESPKKFYLNRRGEQYIDTYKMREKIAGFESFKNFYLKQGKYNDYTLEKVWNLPLKEQEANNDYIQLLFPLDTKSHYNPDAPVLDDEEFEELCKNAEILKNVRCSFQKTLGFFGLEYDFEEKKIYKTASFSEREPKWLAFPGQITQRRITRMLRSLSLLNLRTEASALSMFISNLGLHEGLDERTLRNWLKYKDPSLHIHQ